jgi:hypothetical protein
LKKLAGVADEIGKKSLDYQPFIQQILRLSKEFQTEMIEELLQEYLHNK